MKRKNYLLNAIILLLSVFIVISCKKDKTETPGEGTTNSVEKNKANLQKAGVDFVKQLDEMDNNKGIEAIVNIGDLLNKDDFTDGILDKSNNKSSNVKLNNIFSLLSDIQKFSNKKITITDLYKSMDNSSKSGTKLEEDYNKIVGIYNWNYITQQWDKSTESSTKLILNFPFSKNGTVNNASFTVKDFSAQTITIDEESQEVPVSLNWDLKVDGSVAISYSFSANYVNDRPQDISSTLTVTPFSFNLTVHCTTSNCSFSESLKNGSQLLLGFTAEANGNWSEQNIKDYTFQVPVYDYNHQIMYYEDSVAVDKIFENANVTFTLMNIKFGGVLDFKNLYSTMNNIDNNTYPTDQEYQQAVSNAINKYVNVYIRNLPDNSLIATAEAYVSSRNETNYIWNPETQQMEPQIFVDYFVDFRFKFPDDSKIDLEAYTKEGFNSFVDQLNTFMSDLSTKYGFEFTPIDYGKK